MDEKPDQWHRPSIPLKGLSDELVEITLPQERSLEGR